MEVSAGFGHKFVIFWTEATSTSMQVDASTFGQSKVEGVTPPVHPWGHGQGSAALEILHGYLGDTALYHLGSQVATSKALLPLGRSCSTRPQAWRMADWQNGIETCHG